jgi:hypothetical protein
MVPDLVALTPYYLQGEKIVPEELISAELNKNYTDLLISLSAAAYKTGASVGPVSSAHFKLSLGYYCRYHTLHCYKKQPNKMVAPWSSLRLLPSLSQALICCCVS